MFDFLTIVVIFSAVFGFSIVKAVLNHKKEMKAMEVTNGEGKWKSEKQDMQNKIDKLEQRVIVLEKIVTDQKFDLKQEINAL